TGGPTELSRDLPTRSRFQACAPHSRSHGAARPASHTGDPLRSPSCSATAYSLVSCYARMTLQSMCHVHREHNVAISLQGRFERSVARSDTSLDNLWVSCDRATVLNAITRSCPVDVANEYRSRG